ncbi:MAG: hypothetical protein L0I80_06870, partial [Brevibacterium sp.]|nr:hypothetical protein [Brevibacterium sp.]
MVDVGGGVTNGRLCGYLPNFDEQLIQKSNNQRTKFETKGANGRNACTIEGRATTMLANGLQYHDS